MVLRSAAVKRSDLGAPQRLDQAIQLLRSMPRKERVAAAATLSGKWLLGLKVAKGGTVSFPPSEAQQVLSQTTYERSVRSAVGLMTSSRGNFELQEPEDDAADVMLRLDAVSCSVGPVPLPKTMGSMVERVLFLDSLMCICDGEGGAAVWVRASMAKRL